MQLETFLMLGATNKPADTLVCTKEAQMPSAAIYYTIDTDKIVHLSRHNHF